MKIGEYTQAKLEIADLLRLAAVKVREHDPDNRYPFEDLFTRLAEDRFNIAVIGQFSRGKSSLMNAMLNTDRLPTGVIPLTSVITTVQYGPQERAVIEYEDRMLPQEISLDRIADYVSQHQNPGNEKHIKYARVELPAELLRQGFYLVDTPGLGSAIAENTRTTESFLPEADAFILVTSYESPLSNEEFRLLHTLTAHRYRTFVVINKRDLVSPADMLEADRHIREQIGRIFGTDIPQFFPLSALDALRAEKTGDAAGYAGSGVSVFVERLIAFLIEEKQTEFLRHVMERADQRLSETGYCSDETERLAVLRHGLFQAEPRRASYAPLDDPLKRLPGRFTACAVCQKVEKAAWEFLRQYQYRITIDRKAREQLGQAGGLCAFHTWQYAAIASTQGTCVAFPVVLDQFVERLSNLINSGPDKEETIALWKPSATRCVLCRVCASAETAALQDAAAAIRKSPTGADSPSLCFPHLAILHDTVRDIPPAFLTAQREVWKRVAEDMRRYALKRDGSRRAFATSDETDSDVRGLRLLAGHRALSYPPPLDR